MSFAILEQDKYTRLAISAHKSSNMSSDGHRFAAQMIQLSRSYPMFERSFIMGLLEDQEGDVSDVRHALYVSIYSWWRRLISSFLGSLEWREVVLPKEEALC